MPIRAIANTNRKFVPSGATSGVQLSGGRRSVVWRNASGKSFEAVVVGPGSTSGLLLMIPALRMKGPSVFLRDNVQPATTIKSTNAYFDRWPRPQPAIT